MKFNRCNFLNIYIYIFPSRIKDQHRSIKHQKKASSYLYYPACNSTPRTYAHSASADESGNPQQFLGRRGGSFMLAYLIHWWNTPSTSEASATDRGTRFFHFFLQRQHSLPHEMAILRTGMQATRD